MAADPIASRLAIPAACGPAIPSRPGRHLHDITPVAHGQVVVAPAGAVLADLGLAGDQRGAIRKSDSHQI